MILKNLLIFNNNQEIYVEELQLQRIYDQEINQLDIHQLICNECKTKSYNIHGYYSRSFQMFETSHKLRITRVICTECNKTHAIFFSDIIPYSKYRVQEADLILNDQDNSRIVSELIEKIRRLKKLFFNILLSVGIVLNDSILVKQKNINSSYHISYFQIHRGVVILQT